MQLKTNRNQTESGFTDQTITALKQRLKGFDIELALKRLQGQPQLYLQLLNQFYQDLMQDKVLLLADLSPIRLHAIKGVAGNLGAMKLHNACAQLEQALDQPTAERQAAEQLFWQAFEEVQTGLSQCADLLAEYEAIPAVSVDTKTVTSVSSGLIELLVQKLKQGDLLTKQEAAKLSVWAAEKMPTEQAQALRQALLKLDYLLAGELLNPYV